MTYGEELFLNLYDDLGAHVTVTGPHDIGMEFLVDQVGFQSFSRLVVTFEVFLRCVRSAKMVFGEQPGAPANRFAQVVRRDIDLPPRLLQNSAFAERLKQVGRIVFDKGRNKLIERNATRDEPPHCYLCGVALTEDGGNAQRSIEHVWPQSLGGQTVEANLMLACKDCNSERGHMSTWAVGPVQSTFFTYSTKNPANPEKPLRFSLALARLMDAARPTDKRSSPLTLRDAARKIRPAVPKLDLIPDRPYLYFELLQHLKVSP